MNVITDPGRHDHFVQLYQGIGMLAESVAEYIGTGLARGQAAIVIATAAHRMEFLQVLTRSGVEPAKLVCKGQLTVLDADETLGKLTTTGTPSWMAFREVIGGLIAEVRLQYPTVRAYGEMVDVLWQRGEHEAAMRLEQYWNELRKLQTFSLFCAYRMDPFDPHAYGGPLESVCKVHTHLIPARHAARFDEAVEAASRKILDQPLCDILLSLAARHRTSTCMSLGQATLLWLHQNMPRTAQKVLSEARAGFSSAA